MRIKLTENRIEALKAPGAGEVLVWDTGALAGFGLRVGRRKRGPGGYFEVFMRPEAA